MVYTRQGRRLFADIEANYLTSFVRWGVLVGHRTSKRGHWRFRKEELDNPTERDMPGNDHEWLVALNAMIDLVLAEIWDSEKDAAYDRVWPRRWCLR